MVTSDCMSGNVVEKSALSVPWSSSLGLPQVESVVCGPNKEDRSACRLIVHTPDKAIALLQYSGKDNLFNVHLKCLISSEKMFLPH